MQREKNFTQKEKSYLLDLIFMYRNVIESKITDHLNNLHKDKAWASITQEYNKNTESKRIEKNLRYCWDNIKKGMRKYCAAWKCEMYKTGNKFVVLYVSADIRPSLVCSKIQFLSWKLNKSKIQFKY
ncbi:hypothetical protein ALC57_14571 [Trachymyrmex cornetzi]|uniref:Regulatory protein zeste n=1 Tax=Trachymyrmex cornetzi TaxID=471704 RepID=A0A151IYI1_9HYME|nr:hypothetical protein ALC57_14571 [Trachymyrmex cornetzi]